MQVAAQLNIKQSKLWKTAQSGINTRVRRNLEGFSHSWTRGDPDKQRFAGSLLPGGLTLPAASTFSSPASIPPGMGWKITGSFLQSRRTAQPVLPLTNKQKKTKYHTVI